MGTNDPFYLMLTRPGWEAYVCQFLKTDFEANPFFPTKPDPQPDDLDQTRAVISGYVFAQFPCGKLPASDQLERCTLGSPRYLMVFKGEGKARARGEPRFHCREDDPVIKEALASARRQRPTPEYGPFCMPPEEVLALQEQFRHKIQADKNALIENLLGQQVRIPYGPLMGVRAKVKRIFENKRNFQDSMVQLFTCDSGMLTGIKVTFPLHDLFGA